MSLVKIGSLMIRLPGKDLQDASNNLGCTEVMYILGSRKLYSMSE